MSEPHPTACPAGAHVYVIGRRDCYLCGHDPHAPQPDDGELDDLTVEDFHRLWEAIDASRPPLDPFRVRLVRHYRQYRREGLSICSAAREAWRLARGNP